MRRKKGENDQEYKCGRKDDGEVEELENCTHSSRKRRRRRRRTNDNKERICQLRTLPNLIN